jgi:hypothetical protein
MSFTITTNQAGVRLLTEGNRWVESVDSFLKRIKPNARNLLPKRIINIYENSDNELKKLINKQVKSNLKQINILDEQQDIKKIKTEFKLTNKQVNKLVIKSALKQPLFLSKLGDVIKLNLSDKPLAIREFTDKIKSKKDIINLFTSSEIKKVGDFDVNRNIENVKTTYNISFKFSVKFSDTFENRIDTVSAFDTFKKLNDSSYVKNNYFNFVRTKFTDSGAIEFTNLTYSINSRLSNNKLSLSNMVMLKSNPVNIHNIFNNIIDVKNGNCVVEYLKTVWKKMGINTLNKLKTPAEILSFCKSKEIKTICYDIFGKVVNSYYPAKNNKSYKSLIYICFDNHIYPLKCAYLQKNNIVKFEIKIVDNIIHILKELLNKATLPDNIILDKEDKIVSFTNGTIKYLNNNEYIICKEILHKFGLDDKIYDFIKICNLGGLLQNLYIKDNINSFMPFNYKKEPFIYNSGIESKEYTTIDKNKCYSHSLHSLEYLIKCDIKYNDYIISDKQEFIDSYLYMIEPNESTILLPNKDLYSGAFLSYCISEGLEFKVCGYFETTKHNNDYKMLILDIYDKLNYDINIDGLNINCAKYIINIMIGKFNQPIAANYYKKDIAIVTSIETDYHNGFTAPITNEYNIWYDTYEDVKYIYNKIPIDIQIKDESRLILYKKMKELEISNDDIIQIKTDSITFKGIRTDIETSNHWMGWKYENYNKINKKNIAIKQFDFSYIHSNFNTTLYNCYAGAGKSYNIMKTYKDREDYIILTPKHSANKEYKKKGYNCKVIQTYEFNNTIPKESVIIVDEIGQVSSKGWAIIVKCAMLGKEVNVYGDFKQLKPIEGQIFNSNIFNKYFFSNVKEIKTNYRNNFSIDYYDKLISGEIDNKEVLKYNDIKSDNIICYRNKTKDEYNKRICKKKGIKNIYDVGNRIVCINNELGKNDIFNGFTYTIIDSNNEYIITDDKTKINIKDLKNFDYGWAMTIYKIQGETLDSLYYAPEDVSFLKNEVLYTVISRLKQTLNSDQINNNNMYAHLWN